MTSIQAIKWAGSTSMKKAGCLSLEGLYQLSSPRLKLGGKLAVKRSALRLDRNQDDFINATTTLWIAQIAIPHGLEA